MPCGTENNNMGFAYRRYIDGIRGFSVFFVVLFHTGIKYFGGGFLGVDAFFVLSGFLITSVIMKEISSTGGISIIGFYARRARRILPGASFCLVVVAIAYRLLMDPFTVSQKEKCFIAASTYWANICFISEDTDYWAEGRGTSPIKHYWSLSIEEQFYLLYPFCLWILLKITGRYYRIYGSELIGSVKFRRSFVLLTKVFLFIVVFFSFDLSVYFIYTRTVSECHMNSLVRFYQLGCGGLLSLFQYSRDSKNDARSSSSQSQHLKYASVFSLVLFVLLLSFPHQYFSIHPSVSSMMTVVVVLALIYFVEREISQDSSKEGVTQRILGFYPLIMIGKWSYSIYLFHFPLVVLGDEMSVLFSDPDTISMILRVVCVSVGSILLGIASYYCIERTVMRIKMDTFRKKSAFASMGIVIPLMSALVLSFFIFPSVDKSLLGNELKVENFVLPKNFTTSSHSHGIPSSSNVDLSEDFSDIPEDEVIDVELYHRVSLFGDSHAIMTLKMWSFLQKQVGFDFLSLAIARQPPFILDWDHTKAGTMFTPFMLSKMPGKLCNFDPDILVIFNSQVQAEFIIDSQFFYVTETINTLKKERPCPVDSTCFEEKVYKAFTGFLNQKVDPCNVKKIVYVLPEPLCVGAAECLSELTEDYKEGDCEKHGRYMSSRPAIKKVMERVEQERNDFVVLDVSEFICPVDLMCPAKVPCTICPEKDKTVIVYYDQSHLSKDYWLARSLDFLKFLESHGISFGPPDVPEIIELENQNVRGDR